MRFRLLSNISALVFGSFTYKLRPIAFFHANIRCCWITYTCFYCSLDEIYPLERDFDDDKSGDERSGLDSLAFEDRRHLDLTGCWQLLENRFKNGSQRECGLAQVFWVNENHSLCDWLSRYVWGLIIFVASRPMLLEFVFFRPPSASLYPLAFRKMPQCLGISIKLWLVCLLQTWQARCGTAWAILKCTWHLSRWLDWCWVQRTISDFLLEVWPLGWRWTFLLRWERPS